MARTSRHPGALNEVSMAISWEVRKWGLPGGLLLTVVLTVIHCGGMGGTITPTAISAGADVEILVEGRSKKSAQDAMGRTQTNKIVVFPNSVYSAGKLVQVDIIGAAGHTLFGQPHFKL